MNMQNLMAQAQKMQRDLNKKKEELDNMSFTGSSEWVDVVFSGSKALQSIKIKKTDGIQADDIEMLEDMLNIAIKSAITQVDAETEKKMGSLGNLGLF